MAWWAWLLIGLGALVVGVPVLYGLGVIFLWPSASIVSPPCFWWLRSPDGISGPACHQKEHEPEARD